MKKITTTLVGVLLALTLVFPVVTTNAAGEMWVDTITAYDTQLEQITVTEVKVAPFPGTTVYVNATIKYKDASGVDGMLSMPIPMDARYIYGMAVYFNGSYVTADKLATLKGKKINQLTAIRYDRVYTPFNVVSHILVSQWIVKVDFDTAAAKVATTTTATTATTTATTTNATTNTTTTKLSVAEGFVQGVSSSEITVGKEGLNTTMKVTSASKVIVNGMASSMSTVVVGDIVDKAEYNSANELVNLVISR